MNKRTSAANKITDKISDALTGKISVVRSSAAPADGELLFDGRKMAIALAFHLAEERPGMKVPASAIDALASRLVAAKVQLHVARSLWARLSNPQRLSILTDTIGKHARPWS